MSVNLVNSVNSTSTFDFTGLNFDSDDVKIACNECYADYQSGNYALTSKCFACAEFTPHITEKEAPFLDFITIAIILFIAFLFFKLTFKDIWTD